MAPTSPRATVDDGTREPVANRATFLPCVSSTKTNGDDETTKRGQESYRSGTRGRGRGRDGSRSCFLLAEWKMMYDGGSIRFRRGGKRAAASRTRLQQQQQQQQQHQHHTLCVHEHDTHEQPGPRTTDRQQQCLLLASPVHIATGTLALCTAARPLRELPHKRKPIGPIPAINPPSSPTTALLSLHPSLIITIVTIIIIIQLAPKSPSCLKHTPCALAKVPVTFLNVSSAVTSVRASTSRANKASSHPPRPVFYFRFTCLPLIYD
ncbi:hypothetical protein K490DRAFT_57673 [Saccharata proteae CBS 121410]|uniref:Uncharacterized protein n=1 Tax=Saccharata proteae CBS 121410 TaxID=1314787 RepID=A0A9P4HUJ4_9PEZI|nr:hypothetical protein K490DRAFT_57673 [Saccharata proteae CBS 121410]